ncbi:MAG: hypothetical protein M1825_005424 [Sarcosagium campestre]|nr:MAG: hypothetical protein M1825_005424 [Sarcosagium campestre]
MTHSIVFGQRHANLTKPRELHPGFSWFFSCIQPSFQERKGTHPDVLIPLYQNIRYKYFRYLIRYVVDLSPDTDIWSAIYQLLDSLHTLSPTLSGIFPSHRGTPVNTSSSRLADSETREIVERGLFYKIKNCVYRGVRGFFEKHFSSDGWGEREKEMIKHVLVAYSRRWKKLSL